QGLGEQQTPFLVEIALADGLLGHANALSIIAAEIKALGVSQIRGAQRKGNDEPKCAQKHPPRPQPAPARRWIVGVFESITHHPFLFWTPRVVWIVTVSELRALGNLSHAVVVFDRETMHGTY